MKIKLGMILHSVDIAVHYDTNDNYRPRLKIGTWVICKIGKVTGIRFPITISNGAEIKLVHYVEDGIYFKNRFKVGEVLNGYFKTEKSALKALIEKKPSVDDDEYIDEWRKEQNLINNRLKKL